jgi:hypothetical protein
MPGGHYEPFLSGHEQAAEAELSIRKFTQWASRWVSARSLCRLARGSRYASSRSRRCRRWQPAREKAAAVDALTATRSRSPGALSCPRSARRHGRAGSRAAEDSTSMGTFG